MRWRGRLAQSPLATEVLVAPGNAGTGRRAEGRATSRSPADDLDGLLRARPRRARRARRSSDPRRRSSAGIVDRFEAARAAVLRAARRGRPARRLEGVHERLSRAPRHPDGAPTETFTDVRGGARDYAATREPPIVDQGRRAGGRQGRRRSRRPSPRRRPRSTRMLDGRRFGAAGATVVIEDFLRGEEASFIAMVDGTRVVPLASSQDHKTPRRRRPRPEHGRHGRVFARARS